MRILVVRLSSLGDVVHAIPVMAALRRAFPDARIDWLIDERYRGLAMLVPVVDHRILVPRRLGVSTLSGLTPALRAARYDVALDLQGLVKSAVLARLSGARRVIGFVRSQLREPLAGWFYSETSPGGEATHVIDKNLALLAGLGVPPSAPEFPIDDPVSDALERTLGVLGIGANDRFALINPGAAWASKCWDAELFGGLAIRIQREHGLRSAVVWGADDRSRAERVVAASSGAAVLAPPTTVPDIVALARAAAVMISGDTGPLHLAAAVGTPVVGVYGPSDPDRNGPWSVSDVVVSRFHECQCQLRRPGARGVVVRRCVQTRSCLASITVDEVLRAVSRRLDSIPRVT